MIYDLAYHYEQGKLWSQVYNYLVPLEERRDFLTELKEALCLIQTTPTTPVVVGRG